MALLAVFAATDLIYHFPPLFAVVSTLSLRPNLWDAPLDHALYWRLLLEGDTLCGVMHYLAGRLGHPFAIGVMVLTLRSGGGGWLRSGWDPLAGARISLFVSLAQLPVGVWVVPELPLVVRDANRSAKIS